MFALIWLLIGIIGRCVIHIPDVTPLTTLCLFSSTVFSKRQSCLMLLLILVLSDLCLHYLLPIPAFGSWTIFTYSGWFMTLGLGFLFSKNRTEFSWIYYTVFASFLFWLWTNFGTWITTTLYPHTLQGFCECYIAALPFLRNSVIGSVVWSAGVYIVVSVSGRVSAHQKLMRQHGRK